MSSATLARSAYAEQRSPGSRLSAALLAIAITALVVLMLIRLGLFVPEEKGRPGPTTLTLLPEGQSDTPEPSKAKAKDHASGGAPKRAAKTPEAKAAPTPPLPTPPVPAVNVIWMSHDEMAAADISTKPTRAQARASQLAQGGDGQGSGRADGDGAGAGSGPSGQRLYKADWYVRPTDAQLATYMPQRSQTGWGEIACRTAPQYRVEDCEELGETPGSGFSRALREAAWQFKVLPPRINGRPQVGTWVRIHFDFTPRDAG